MWWGVSALLMVMLLSIILSSSSPLSESDDMSYSDSESSSCSDSSKLFGVENVEFDNLVLLDTHVEGINEHDVDLSDSEEKDTHVEGINEHDVDLSDSEEKEIPDSDSDSDLSFGDDDPDAKISFGDDDLDAKNTTWRTRYSGRLFSLTRVVRGSLQSKFGQQSGALVPERGGQNSEKPNLNHKFLRN